MKKVAKGHYTYRGFTVKKIGSRQWTITHQRGQYNDHYATYNGREECRKAIDLYMDSETEEWMPRPKRTRHRGNGEYRQGAVRFLKAYADRCSEDVEEFAELVRMKKLLEAETERAARALHASGFSWTEIADRVGVSRQYARQKWAPKKR